MKRLCACLITCFALASAPIAAQSPGGPPHDPIAEHVLPPELIVQHQKAIGLTDAQRTALIGEVKRVQSRMIDLQWDLQRAVERMSELIGQDKVDEAAALNQLDKVLTVEREIKRAHIALAARLKNLLTPEQQRTLRELRAASSTQRR